MASATNCDEPAASGRVSVARLRDNWRTFEDCAFAERLQSEEITSHYLGNRQRNHQIRDDFPRALEEQMQEQQLLRQKSEKEQQRRQELEIVDQQIARELQLQDSEEYQAERDRVFAKKLQQLELKNSQKQSQPAVPQPSGATTKDPPPLVPRQKPPPLSRTPPLPVLSNGDVPHSPSEDGDVLPHLRGGVKYNDEQYRVKLARPAVVTAEPLYANNKPEHYAVSSSAGAAAGASIDPRTEPMSGLLLGAAGLSQKDVALSKRAEEQLEQERKDARLARRLQREEESEMEMSHHQRQRHASGDFDYAMELQQRDEARLRRAKESAREKKRIQKLQQREEKAAAAAAAAATQPDTVDESTRSESRASKRSQTSLADRGAAAAAVTTTTESHNLKLPARRPYVNTDAIDFHQCEFVSADDEEEEEASLDRSVTREDNAAAEPQYANVGQPAESQPFISLHQDHFGQVTRVTPTTTCRRLNVPEDRQIIPPYMPMQQQGSKRSHSIEKRIKKKKEKEGCKQQ